jgi:hypothetical protein
MTHENFKTHNKLEGRWKCSKNNWKYYCP